MIHSQTQNLGYDVAYKVYLPHNYQDVNNLAVVYVTDGQEYSDDRLGAMVIVLDNLIFTNKIEPIIVVFIDPRDPSSPAINRRMSEYTANPRFANFVADELVPVIDSDYKTESLAERRPFWAPLWAAGILLFSVFTVPTVSGSSAFTRRHSTTPS